jgi:RNA polymerase sigma-70 factor (ECF subfamily)
MDSLTDEQLMTQLQQGQTLALDELYHRYSQKLYTFCHYTMHSPNPQDNEDLVQDVFVRLIKSAHTFNPRRASFRTWMFRIARNRCIDVIRHQERIKNVPLAKKWRDDSEEDAVPENTIVDANADVEGLVMQNAVMGAVRDCIEELQNEDERQAFLLYYLGGKVYREIGQILKKSINTAKKRIESARDKVKRCLEQKGMHPLD